MAVDTMQFLPSYEQMERLIAAMNSQQSANLDDLTGLSDLEKRISKEFIAKRTGKVFATKVWKYATNHTIEGVRMRDSVGLTCAPSTDSVEGQDDFMSASPIFQWWHCNYTRDDDSTARPTAMEYDANYKTEGAVDVGTLSPTFWWAVEEHATYQIWYISDTPHPELGLVPWKDAVKANGTVLPFYIDSSYNSTDNAEGEKIIPRSLPDKCPNYNNSYNNMIPKYQQKGTGYWGGGDSVNLLGYIFYVIKYACKSSRKYFRGHADTFLRKVKCAVGETKVTRVLLADQGVFYVGGCVSVGVANGTSTDYGEPKMSSLANRVRVKSIEEVTVGGIEYVALNLDTSKTFDTTTDTYVSPMPCWNGETDKVIGKYDGSYLSNTDGCHTFRIKGIEYMNGQAIIPSDVVMERDDDNGMWNVFTAPKGVKHVADAHTGYKLTGKIPALSGDYYSGDVQVDYQTGGFNPCSQGGGDAVGTGDRVWGPQLGAGTNGEKREKYSLGALWNGSGDGFCLVSCGYDLGRTSWNYGSRD